VNTLDAHFFSLWDKSIFKSDLPGRALFIDAIFLYRFVEKTRVEKTICNVFANYMQLYYKKESNTIYNINRDEIAKRRSRWFLPTQ